jgi:hypothetical protein
MTIGNYVQSKKCSFLQLSVKMAASMPLRKEVMHVAVFGTADEMKKLLEKYGTDCLR